MIKSLIKKNIPFTRTNYINNCRKKCDIRRPVCIISNNCSAGYIYSMLGLQFCSPTIALSFDNDDFVIFAKNFRDYLACDFTESNPSKGYITASLVDSKKVLPTICLSLVHYSSFSEASDAWYRRKERTINYFNEYKDYLVVVDLSVNDKIKLESLLSLKESGLSYLVLSPNMDAIYGRKDINHFIYNMKNHVRDSRGAFALKNHRKTYFDDFDYLSWIMSELCK